MRNLKKLASVVLAAVMTLALAVPAFAAEFNPEQPGITIENAQKGVTYNVYEIFKMTGSGSNYSYEATDEWEGFFATGAAGAGYITEVTAATDEANKNFPVNIGTKSYYLNLVNEGTDANIVAFAKGAQAYAMMLETPTASETADADGALNFQLELGYYLVNPYGLSQQSGESAGSLCNLTIAKPNQSIKVKAEKPAIDKTAEDGASAVVKGVGDTVNFTITGKVPDTSDYKENTYKYIVSDKMSSGLTYNSSSLKVVLVAADGDETDITEDCAIDNNVADKDFSLSIPVENYQSRIDDTIKITYTATVNANAVESTNPETNEATLTYSNDPKSDGTGVDNTTTTTKVTVTVYDVQINVDKYALNANDNTNTSTKLAGARFALKNENGKYYKYTAAVEANPAEEIEAQEAKLEWVDSLSDNPTIATTNDDGTLDIVFKGLSPNVKYYLEETEAPTGYNKMAADKEIIVKPETSTDNKGTESNWVKVSETIEDKVTTVTYLNTQSLNYVESVMNSTGAELPETGGMGTTLFYAVGGLLVVGAGVLLIVKKRMGAE